MDALHLFSSHQLCVRDCVCVCESEGERENEHFLSYSVFLNYPPSFHLLWVWVGLYSPGGLNIFCASKRPITHKFTHTSQSSTPHKEERRLFSCGSAVVMFEFHGGLGSHSGIRF